jgi:diketogulonate reductase-like aldo/keto reductase
MKVMRSHSIGRRRLLQGIALALGAASMRGPNAQTSSKGPVALKPVPSTGETLPVIGLGTWITFNVGNDRAARDACAEVMKAFFESGGRMIDSSPMYGSAQPVIGYGLQKLAQPKTLFSADKVWTSGDGPAQIAETRRHWGVERFDLLQVHNLVDWETKLPLLFEMKAQGKLRYVGITTSEGRRHDLFEQIMRDHPLDFVQLTYNAADREAEERLLPLAAERGMAVIVNRPFAQGALTRRLEGEKLPDWAGEIGATSWAQILLKFILAHPAVTVAIPATSRVDHVRENLAAAADPLPDDALRERISTQVQEI